MNDVLSMRMLSQNEHMLSDIDQMLSQINKYYYNTTHINSTILITYNIITN